MSNSEEESYHLTVTFILGPPLSSMNTRPPPTNYTQRNLRPLRHRQVPSQPIVESIGRLAPFFLLNLFFSGLEDVSLQGQPRASEASISALEILSTISEKRWSKHKCCAICQEDFPKEIQTCSDSDEEENCTKIVRLPCHHLFHRKCIVKWLKMSCTCPSCRYELLTENDEYNIGVRERMARRDLEMGSDTDAEDDKVEESSKKRKIDIDSEFLDEFGNFIMLDVEILEPGYTNFYEKTQKTKTMEFKRKVLEPGKVDKMETSLTEIYSPESTNDNFWFLAKFNATVQNEFMTSTYEYSETLVTEVPHGYSVTPVKKAMEFKTRLKVAKTGLLLVGWGGNNGSTLTAALIANKNNLSWKTKEGTKVANYFGSLTMASTTRLGIDSNGKDVYVPFSSLLPMVHPNDLIVSGWDINSADLSEAMERAKVLDWDLQEKLREQMKEYKPLKSIYYPDFIAANQNHRANNLKEGTDKKQHLEEIRKDIREFKLKNGLEKVIVLWTANTERYSAIIPNVNDTADNLIESVEKSHSEISPSTIFAIASILEGSPFINGSPQNTFVPGVIELAEKSGVFIAGDDFKSGQTKLKSVLVDFLVNAGIKPLAITSYNHLGNNDGFNLSAPEQFRSKEISKSNVVDDVVSSNSILYSENEYPDHTVVIKYVPSVGDSKRAMDEYVSEIFMGGKNTITIYNVCEDSLLATPLILDLVILTELFTRISFRKIGSTEFKPFHPVLSILGYMLKAPIVPNGKPVVNALAKQRSALENTLRACLGLSPASDMASHIDIEGLI